MCTLFFQASGISDEKTQILILLFPFHLEFLPLQKKYGQMRVLKIKSRLFAVIVMTLCISCNSGSNINIESVASPKGTEVFQPNWDNIAKNYQFPEWFFDAKFGIFIQRLQMKY
jgi:hypothetical protein